jgi:hypothetical protein
MHENEWCILVELRVANSDPCKLYLEYFYQLVYENLNVLQILNVWWLGGLTIIFLVKLNLNNL